MSSGPSASCSRTRSARTAWCELMALMNLKAIETVYGGCRFRSRLEARWAVFFDHLEIEWVYEKEGFDLEEHGWYLPDFWLPKVSLRGDLESIGIWAEVKPVYPPEEETLKFYELARGTGNGLVLLCGEKVDSGGTGGGHYEFSGGWDNCMVFMRCKNPKCGHIKVEYPEYWNCPKCGASTSVSEESDDPIEHAVIAANSARFERGPSPFRPGFSFGRSM